MFVENSVRNYELLKISDLSKTRRKQPEKKFSLLDLTLV